MSIACVLYKYANLGPILLWMRTVEAGLKRQERPREVARRERERC